MELSAGLLASERLSSRDHGSFMSIQSVLFGFIKPAPSKVIFFILPASTLFLMGYPANCVEVIRQNIPFT